MKLATFRDYERAKYWDGFDESNQIGRRMCVCYAVFDFGPGPGSMHTAGHEAAHAVIAWRLNIPVRALILSGDGEMRGGAVCDWESLRGNLSNRDTCIRGFAVAFAGALHDVHSDEDGADFDEIWNQSPTDSGVVVETRDKLRDWEMLAPTADTDQESMAGYRLADRLIGEELDRIGRLGKHLLQMRHMDEEAILNWFAQDEAEHT